LFTGSECPPCVAADFAFEALSKTFKPTEAILLQYHEHIPQPDPLTNADGEARMNYYKEAFDRMLFGGTPSMVFHGAQGPRGAGPRDNAQRAYEQFHETISDELDQPARASLKLNATRKGDKIDISAEVADLKETGDSLRLRLVLVEEKV